VISQSGLPYLRVDGVPARPPAPAAYQLAAKRVLDIALVLCALLALAPLLLGVAAAIKLSSKGPVLFRQERVGRDGRPFMILKYRTMFADKCDASGVAQTRTGDQRITPLGQFLRRTSIDELPQLINVLMGDMSLVGPRPHVAGMLAGGKQFEELVPYYDMRYVMRPGLTGWAQANGLRGPTVDPVVATKRIDHDIAYIQNYSVLLDVKIIFITLQREFLSGSGV
jgi:lipopolysaccharide/colanic/teichoic acid biosynthesis glycosyltransferase